MRRYAALPLLLAFALGFGLSPLDAHAQTGAGAAPAGIQTTGGPDSFGYTFRDSLETGCGYNWSSIVGLTGTTNLNLTDDSSSAAQNLGFSFSFYGTAFTQAFAGSNGIVTFGSGSSILTNQCPMPSTTTPNNTIAGIWDDMLPSGSANVYFNSFGAGACPGGRAPACAIFQWDNVPYYSGGGVVTYQVILRADNVIELQFNTVGQTGSASTTGIENSGGTVGLTYFRAGTGCNVANSVLSASAAYFLPPDTSACNPAAATNTPVPPTATPAPVGGIDVGDQVASGSPARTAPSTDGSPFNVALVTALLAALGAGLVLAWRHR
jgi:hypothetical protein